MPNVPAISAVDSPPRSSLDSPVANDQSGVFAGLLHAQSSPDQSPSAVGPTNFNSESTTARQNQSQRATPASLSPQPNAETAQLVSHVKSLINQGVPLKKIAETVAGSIAKYFAAGGRANDSAGTTAADQGKTLNERVAALLAKLTAALKGSASAQSAVADDGSLQGAIGDLVAALTDQSQTGKAGDASKTDSDLAGSGGSQDAFLGRIAQLFAQALDVAAPKTTPSTSSSDPTTSAATQSTAGPGQDTGKSLDAPAAGALPIPTLAALTQTALTAAAAALAGPAGGSNAGVAKTSNEATATTVSNAHTDAHSALGLIDAINGTRNPKTAGADANALKVHSIGAFVSSVDSSSSLLRSLERAANAAITRDTATGNDAGASLLSTISQGLQTLTLSVTAPAAPADAAQNSSTNAALVAGIADAAKSVAVTTTQAPAAKPTLPLVSDDVHNIVNQIVNSVTMRTVAGLPTLRIVLTPAHLGEITVNLAVNSDRSLSATLVTSSADVGATVLANSAQLTRAFSDAGLKLSQLGVDVANQGMGDNNNRSQQEADAKQAQRFG